MAEDLPIDDAIVVPERAMSWTAVRAGGPGGQNVNKVATKVELRLDIGASGLPNGARERLRKIAASRIDREGRLVVASSVARTQAQNLADAREKLARLIRAALVVPKHRRPTKPSRAAKRRRLEGKRRQSEKKAVRAKISPD